MKTRCNKKDWFGVLKDRIWMYRRGLMSFDQAIDQIGNKINWCYKFKKITRQQMTQLCDDYQLAMEGW